MTFHFSSKTWLGKVAAVLLLPLMLLAAQPAFAQSAEVRSMGVYYLEGTANDNINNVYCNWSADKLTENQYRGGFVNVEEMGSTNDPWQTSALIEYDQPFPSPEEKNAYPNHCLGICMDIYCTNKPNGAATYSVSFPIQNVRFEIAKYYGSKDIANPDTNPAVRVIDMSLENNYIVGGANPPSGNIDLSDFMCAAYSCWGARASWENTSTCPNPIYECDSNSNDATCKKLTGEGGTKVAKNVCGAGGVAKDIGSFTNGEETACIVRASGTGKGYNDPIKFCTSWDGSYEILGEFGKTNGQFGVRGTIHTDYPGDGIAVENITIDQTFTYPGNNQYPIQVDVTNVHTVRSTPSVVGSITSVPALPYTMTYRLSKDADVKMEIFDASEVGTTNSAVPGNLVRTLVDWQPRLGEGFKGSDSDKLLVESESWDGRDDSGRLLPANNYLVSIQAKSQDEFRGTDLS
ncbi:MAG: hypothetical protein IJ311_05630, partial [Elusimicrobiaceae bacterium]|nr:hypothetical protein [Elusimicrobiaceae bacterium]